MARSRIIARALVLALFVVTFMFLSGLFVFASEPYGPTHSGSLKIEPTDTTSDGKVYPGSKVAVSGSGFVPHTKIDILWNGKALNSYSKASGTTTNAKYSAAQSGSILYADAGGAAAYAFEIPKDATPGIHTISMMGAAAGGGTLVLSTDVFVEGEKIVAPVIPNLDESPALRNTELPLTGGELQLYLLIAGISFVFLGLSLRFVAFIY